MDRQESHAYEGGSSWPLLRGSLFAVHRSQPATDATAVTSCCVLQLFLNRVLTLLRNDSAINLHLDPPPNQTKQGVDAMDLKSI